jgi:hypothetical protein
MRIAHWQAVGCIEFIHNGNDVCFEKRGKGKKSF